MSQISRPATAAEIIEIVGPLDDFVLMRIVETEATPTEVVEAFTWATADDQIGMAVDGQLKRCRRRAAAASAHRWSSAACIG